MVRYDFNANEEGISFDNSEFYQMRVQKQTGSGFILYCAAIYRIDYLKKKMSAHVTYMPVDSPFGHLYPLELQNEYIWGVELISGLQQGQVEEFHISQEHVYIQSARFLSPYILHLQEELESATMANNTAKIAVINSLLSSFISKFSQRFFPTQQVIHQNDIELLKKD